MQFTLMTYNIHKGIGGVDRKYKLERIIETIAHYSPDILLLQEVDDGVPRSNRERQVDLIGEALSLEHGAYQANVKLKYGCYGNAILSRWPLHEVHDVELTIWPKKRRRAQVVKLQVRNRSSHGSPETRTVVIANVHLGLAAFERKRQLRTLLSCNALNRLHRSTPVVVAGDFNDVWQNLGNGQLSHDEFQSALGRAKTFPAALPLRSLDGIYYRGPLSVVRGFAGHITVAQRASDHLPAIAELAVR